MARSSRGEWAKRVERWQRSGLTAAEFAAQAGVNASTLSYWKWRLCKEAGRGGTGDRRAKRAQAAAVDFVEVTGIGAAAASAADAPVEVVVGERYVVRVGTAALRRARWTDASPLPSPLEGPEPTQK